MGPRSWVLGARFRTAPLGVVAFCRTLVDRPRAENVRGLCSCDDDDVDARRRPTAVRDDTGNGKVAARRARRSSIDGGRMVESWVVLLQPPNYVQASVRMIDIVTMRSCRLVVRTVAFN